MQPVQHIFCLHLAKKLLKLFSLNFGIKKVRKGEEKKRKEKRLKVQRSQQRTYE